MIQLGSDSDFAALRSLLQQCEFDETHLCAAPRDSQSLDNFEEDFERASIQNPDQDALSVLIELFVEGHYLRRDLAEERFGASAFDAMSRLGLLSFHDHQIASTAALYPTAGVWIASDRWNTPDRSEWKTPPDVVYPAIVSNAQRFLRFMPQTACDSLLELCSGTAVAALRGAKQFAQDAWAIDISDRATLFGEFNRRLNDIASVTVATGDLYEPAGDRMFDRIVAHPPYVPVLRPKWVYQDGGEDGEQIVRRCIEGIPDHLQAGGLFYLLAMGSDRDENPWERRIRSWLGENEGEFDVGVFVVRTLDPDEFAVRAAINSEHPPQDVREFKRLFAALGMRQMVYALVLIQRRNEIRTGVYYPPSERRCNFHHRDSADDRVGDTASSFRRQPNAASVMGARQYRCRVAGKAHALRLRRMAPNGVHAADQPSIFDGSTYGPVGAFPACCL